MLNRKQLAQDVYNCLHECHPKKISFIEHKDTFQLLIGVILSAQTTDAQVNRVLPELIEQFSTPVGMAGAPLEKLEELVRPVGFYRAKAKNVKTASQVLVDRFGGDVPASMDDLLMLPGVGRKSANVILGTCFGKPAIIVDTHFRRVVKRLGFTEFDNPDIIEKELKGCVPRELQYRFSMLINNHGRVYCTSAKPLCDECPLLGLCPHGSLR